MTQLCMIPTCRLRGRHLPTCEGDCGGCLPRVAEAGLVCEACLGRAAARLEPIRALTEPARLVAAGLVRRGAGGSSGKPGSRPPLNVDALDVLDEVQTAITTIAREIAETRGLTIGGDGPRGPLRAPQTDQNRSAHPTSTTEPAGEI